MKHPAIRKLKKAFLSLALGQDVKNKKLKVTPELISFIDRFRSNYVSCDLIRIGGRGDGGYLAPDALQDVKYCFSPGVGRVSNFENELSEEYGIKCFLADASVDSLPIENKNFHFLKKFLGNNTFGNVITLSDWIDQSIGKDNAPRLLQMDIEGAEYDVLTYESVETIGSFSVVIVEFHGLENLFDRYFLRMVATIFEKFYKNFKIAHVHPNNCRGIFQIDGIGVPPVMEVTFVRQDLISKCVNQSTVSLPHILDQKNIGHHPDVVMPEIWWKPVNIKTDA